MALLIALLLSAGTAAAALKFEIPVDDEAKAALIRNGGIHVHISTQDGKLIVQRTLPGGPADKAGIRAGDEIVQVEEEWIQGMSMEAAVEIIKGMPGSQVELLIRRPGQNRSFRVKLTRAELPPNPALRPRMIPFPER